MVDLIADRGPSETIRLATAADVTALANSLAAAFLDDPVMGYLFPDGGRRFEQLRTMFTVMARSSQIPQGTVWCDEGVRAVAIWAEPGGWRDIDGRMAAHAGELVAAFGDRLGPLGEFLAAVAAHHPDDEPHWYLPVLGTEPAAQGTGLGSAVLAPVLERCDGEGVAAYLESSKEENIAFYRRHGFEVVEELHPVADGPRLWPMWRSPRAA